MDEHLSTYVLLTLSWMFGVASIACFLLCLSEMREKRQKADSEKANSDISFSAIEEAIIEYWGERCEPPMLNDCEAKCPCCEAWREYDILLEAFNNRSDCPPNHK